MQNSLKDRVFHIVCERNLCSYMNNTKWRELIHAIETEDVDYWGDWTGENFPSQEYYFNIEWIKVRPCYLKYRGKMIAPELVNESNTFEDILKKYHIPFEEKNGAYCIYGYR